MVKGEQGVSFSLPATPFLLTPGETLDVDMEPPTDEEAVMIEAMKSNDAQRRHEFEARCAAEAE